MQNLSILVFTCLLHNSTHTVTTIIVKPPNIFAKIFCQCGRSKFPVSHHKDILPIQQLAATAHTVTSIIQNVRRHRNEKQTLQPNN